MVFRSPRAAKANKQVTNKNIGFYQTKINLRLACKRTMAQNDPLFVNEN